MHALLECILAFVVLAVHVVYKTGGPALAVTLFYLTAKEI